MSTGGTRWRGLNSTAIYSLSLSLSPLSGLGHPSSPCFVYKTGLIASAAPYFASSQAGHQREKKPSGNNLIGPNLNDIYMVWTH